MKRIFWLVVDMRGVGLIGAALGLVLALAWGPAHADVVATMKAADGSVLALFDENDWCTQIEGQDAAALDAGLTVRAVGCWKRDGDTVMIHWRGVGQRAYGVSHLQWRVKPQS